MTGPKGFDNARGFFFEKFHQKTSCKATGLSINFEVDHPVRSANGVLNRFCYQGEQSQVEPVRGAILDVTRGMRRGSLTSDNGDSNESSEENDKKFLTAIGVDWKLNHRRIDNQQLANIALKGVAVKNVGTRCS